MKRIHCGGSGRGARLRKIWLVSVLLLAGGAAAVFAALPGLRAQLIEEDRFLEDLTGGLFLLAFGLGCAACLHRHEGASGAPDAPDPVGTAGTLGARPGRRRGGWARGLIPLIGLLGFLDETHFGAGRFRYDAIRFGPGGAYVIDGVHDLFTLPFLLWRDLAPGWWDWAIAIALGAGVGLAVALRRRYMPRVMHFVRAQPAFDYLRLAAILVGLALVADLDLLVHPAVLFAEELLETLAALTLCFASMALFGEPRGREVTRGVPVRGPDSASRAPARATPRVDHP